jgi:L1 cell adhesion molecule like protein
VSALEKGSGKTQKITITNDKGRLSKDQIEEMLKNSERFKEEDEKNKKRIDAKNDLEGYVYNSRNSLSTAETPAAKEIKPSVDKIVKEAQDWLDSNTTASTEEFVDKKKEVEEQLAPLMAKLYSGGGQGPHGTPPGASSQGPNIEEVD